MEKYRLVQEHKADAGEDYLDLPVATTTTTTNGPANNNNLHHHHPATTKAMGGASQHLLSPNYPEVRITQQGKPRNYISYAMNLFSDGSQTIVLKAMGRAINKAVTIAEILKRKMPLHQMNILSSVEMIDVYEPVEEGLDVVTSRRYVSCMKITLSRTADGLDTTHSGYQPPLRGEEMSPGDHYHPHLPAAAAGPAPQHAISTS